MSGSSSEKWAVVPGAWDGVQVLLAQLKGCTLSDGAGGSFDPATMNAASARASDDCTSKGLLVLDDVDAASANFVPTFLAGSSLSEYDALFINCGANYSDSGIVDPAPAVDPAVQAFSAAGKHI
jgi:hypothetical protein